MPLTVERKDERADHDERRDRRESRSPVSCDGEPQRQRQRIDVTDLHVAGIGEYVRSNVETDAVSLEHRGGRTYLLLEE
ncbi:hypothetical protein [Natrinema sp. SYSU A 869]|uniref:hypothetical protein n=1 Tax=Natrinema sp. SYSU A 869 TaxID=2871694 RepID=UPI001CA403FF|nr:hypothetical protein [Natrinema sp. SYSU A 869]